MAAKRFLLYLFFFKYKCVFVVFTSSQSQSPVQSVVLTLENKTEQNRTKHPTYLYMYVCTNDGKWLKKMLKEKSKS